MKEKKKTLFTFKFPHSFSRVPVPHEQGHREQRGINDNLISAFSHWRGTPPTQLCPWALLCPRQAQTCVCVWVPVLEGRAVLLT